VIPEKQMRAERDNKASSRWRSGTNLAWLIFSKRLNHTSPFMVMARQAPTTSLPSLRPPLYKDFHTRYKNSATLRYGYRGSRRPSPFSTTRHRRLHQSVPVYCPFETRCYCESKTIRIAFSLPNLLFAPHPSCRGT